MKSDAFQDRRLKKSAVFFGPKLGRTGKKGLVRVILTPVFVKIWGESLN